MAQPQVLEKASPVNARSDNGFSVPIAEQPAPEAMKMEPDDFEADYNEDRSVPALAEWRRQALAKTNRSFVDMDLP